MQITAACSTLTDSYQQAHSTYQTAIAPIVSQAKATLATVLAAWQTAEQTQSWTAYRAAVTQALSTLKGLRFQQRSAQQAYITAIRAARDTFWTTVHALPGGNSLPGDSGTPTVPTVPTVPSGV